MLQDYPINQQPTKTSKLLATIEFLLILLAIQAVLLVFGQQTDASDATQFRILANSNTAADQQVKRDVQQKIAPLLAEAINESANPQQIAQRLRTIEPALLAIAQAQAKDAHVTIEHGAALIPPKRIGFFIQSQDVRDAYVVKIGAGKGDNWWCSLFPNVCFPEESTMAETEEEPVKFFIWEWIKSLFK